MKNILLKSYPTTCLFILMLFALQNAYAQKEKQLDSLFQTLYKQGVFNGSVLVAEEGKPIYQKALGYANLSTHQALDSETMFELASVSKQFTAMAIMQLHEKKLLHYSDDIRTFFPQIPYQGITVQQLLHHTSGLPEFLVWDQHMINVNRINDNQDILAALMEHKPTLPFKPGALLSYSNTNYVLLALIVEQLSGKSFANYLKEAIFKPLQMNHTQVYPQRAAAEKIKNFAFGYIYNPSRNQFTMNDSISSNLYQYYFDGVAGPYGISSTPADLLKWDQALYGSQLISTAEQNLAYLTDTLNNGKKALFEGIPYGFGWLMMPDKEGIGRKYMHTGGYPGYETIIARYPDHNKTLIIFNNLYNTLNIYSLAYAVENILFDKPFQIPKAKPFEKGVVLSPAQLQAITGTYALAKAPKVKFTITSDATQAYAQLSGQPKVEIYAQGELEFVYTVVAAKIKFTKDKEGNINKLTLYQNGQEMEALKE